MSQGCLRLHLCVKLYNEPSCRVEALQETSLRTLLTNITAKTMVGHGKTTFSRHSKSWSKENSDAGSLILKQSFNSPGGSVSKESACNAGDLGLILRSGRSPGKGKGNSLHYSCWEIPWTEERGGLQSTGHESVMTAWRALKRFEKLMGVICISMVSPVLLGFNFKQCCREWPDSAFKIFKAVGELHLKMLQSTSKLVHLENELTLSLLWDTNRRGPGVFSGINI